MRIFPRLESVWGNLYYDDSRNQTWERDRRVCSRKFFPAYFTLDISGDVLPRKEVASVIAVAGDEAALKQKFRDAIKLQMKSGRSKASVMLDELMLSADNIKTSDIPTFLKTVLSLYEELWLESDRARGMMAIADNRNRLHWLINNVQERIPLAERNEMWKKALANAPTACLIDFAERLDDQHKPASDGSLIPEEQRFVDARTAKGLVALAVKRMKSDAKNGKLGQTGRPMRALYGLQRMLPNGPEEVLKISSTALKDDVFVLNLAVSAIGQTWSQGMGMVGLADTVAMGMLKVSKRDISNVVDFDAFIKRLNEIRDSGELTDAQKEVLGVFFQLWEKAENEEAA